MNQLSALIKNFIKSCHFMTYHSQETRLLKQEICFLLSLMGELTYSCFFILLKYFMMQRQTNKQTKEMKLQFRNEL
jgi:hypothetical protein